jgi:hypothetical protein
VDLRVTTCFRSMGAAYQLATCGIELECVLTPEHALPSSMLTAGRYRLPFEESFHEDMAVPCMSSAAASRQTRAIRLKNCRVRFGQHIVAESFDQFAQPQQDPSFYRTCIFQPVAGHDQPLSILFVTHCSYIIIVTISEPIGSFPLRYF